MEEIFGRERDRTIGKKYIKYCDNRKDRGYRRCVNSKFSFQKRIFCA